MENVLLSHSPPLTPFGTLPPMMSGRQKPILAAIVSVVLVLAAVAVGWRLVNGDNSLLRDVTVSEAQITPNADGDQDATQISYEISRNATVSISFENEAGAQFFFRREKQRGAGDYQVLFSGVVDGYLLPDENVEGEVLTRLLQDGAYTWTVTAVDDNGVTEQAQGAIDIVDADPVLPLIRNLTVWPLSRVFTPNRDGIDDRVQPQFWLEKDVDEVRVYLVTPDGIEVPISELERDTPADEMGYHVYDYAGGVDEGATPPDDGTYPLVVEARDEEGQRVRVEDELTIQFGGVPRADVYPPPAGDTVAWSATAVSLCETVTFTLTVRNYGQTPIRTSGPAPGLTYDSNWNYNTVGWPTESGVFRVGIGFENELSNYPYRWALGSLDDLEKIGDHYYLMPGARTVITGSIRVVDEFGVRNPQPMWAGLIHEDVEISEFNNRVDPVSMLVELPDDANRQACEPREIPVRDVAADE